LVLPPLVRQVTDFIQAIPNLVDDLVAGRGQLGFLQRDYHIVDRIRSAIEEHGAGSILGVTAPALAVAQSVFSVIIGSVAIAFLDLVPLAGATMAAVIVSAVVFVELGWIQGVIIIGFFLVYQQLENHILQPVIYGRTVRLSPLVVLVSVLIGAELAGILGAL